ncbi:hypothetical protein PHMEG_00017378 [Phytophthora megakarya]|uniref:Uncharacterized protein n=1 Tax=Phytophthora megakarya TaxID=4795 RepID=A0A225VWE8_9STRA|nr:hypothetical protein PHMEG_00017378 [Phytophthora megakarya]
MRGDPPSDHASFITQLHALLLDVGSAEFADTPDDSSSGRAHKLAMDNEWVEVNGIRKRRQRLQVVSAIKLDIRRATCNLILNIHAVYLCDKVRHDHYPNNNLTCYEIWHQLWSNRSERPRACCGRRIQIRGPGKKHDATDEDDDAEDEDETPHNIITAADTTSEAAEDTAAA